MSCNIRCRTHQCLITDLADLNYIICHQTMTSLNQFQSGLAFTDPTLTHDQDAYTIYIHKYSVNWNAWSKLHIQPADQLTHKRGSLFAGSEHRNIILFRGLYKLRFRLKIITEYNTRYFMCQKLFIDFIFSLSRKCLKIGTLYISNNLNTIQIKMIKKTRQLQSRSVDIRYMNLTLGNIHSGSEIFQIHLFYNLS